MLEEAHPYRRHAEAERTFLLDGELIEVLAIQMRSRQHQLGAAQSGRIGNAPGVDMKQRHCEQGAVGAAQLQAVHLADQQGMKIGRAVAVEHALRVAGGAGSVAQRRCRVFIEQRPLIVAILLRNQVFVGFRLGGACRPCAPYRSWR
jgi:hypothetical protein